MPSTASVLAVALATCTGATAGLTPGLPNEPAVLRRDCPSYLEYSQHPHPPYSGGPLKLPFQRPSKECRKFTSPAVEKVIDDVSSRIVDKDLAQLFRNAFPNTLDTTVRWHKAGSESNKRADSEWTGAQSFIVTGDINAEWLRDSTNQLAGYQLLAKDDKDLYSLILGAINTQAEFVIESPYCNAFQPPPPSGLKPTDNGQKDTVHPPYDSSFVFECKYELDSLANFLGLGTDFHEHTGSTEFLTPRWYQALDTLLRALDEQAQPTFNESGVYVPNEYRFQRLTTLATETLPLGGNGNPLNSGVGLLRSAFRPSDDHTIFGYFIPANAQIAVQLQKTATAIRATGGNAKLADEVQRRGDDLVSAVWKHGVINHPQRGEVFAFEVDGYGSQTLMDDANIPSLLSLPKLGFLERQNRVYQNTRKMILSADTNPYYMGGSAIHGVGSPHTGFGRVWPMGRLVQAMTSNSDAEIMECINSVRDSSLLGLVHESIAVNNITDYTRPWFAWANSVFAQTILQVAEEKPYLIFGEGAEPYVIG